MTSLPGHGAVVDKLCVESIFKFIGWAITTSYGSEPTACARGLYCRLGHVDLSTYVCVSYYKSKGLYPAQWEGMVLLVPRLQLGKLPCIGPISDYCPIAKGA